MKCKTWIISPLSRQGQINIFKYLQWKYELLLGAQSVLCLGHVAYRQSSCHVLTLHKTRKMSLLEVSKVSFGTLRWRVHLAKVHSKNASVYVRVYTAKAKTIESDVRWQTTSYLASTTWVGRNVVEILFKTVICKFSSLNTRFVLEKWRDKFYST